MPIEAKGEINSVFTMHPFNATASASSAGQGGNPDTNRGLLSGGADSKAGVQSVFNEDGTIVVKNTAAAPQSEPAQTQVVEGSSQAASN